MHMSHVTHPDILEADVSEAETKFRYNENR